MATKQFKLPDVGEGLTEGEILQWLVAVGDTVTVNQPLCEVETAKAAVELPSPYAGTVTELLFDAGTMVDVGTPIITIDDGAAGGAPAPAAPAARRGEAVATAVAAPPVTATVPVAHPPLLTTAPDADTKPVRHGGLEVGRQAEAHALQGDAAPSSGVEHGHRRPRPLAKPPVRKYAKDLGVDLTTVSGTGNGGMITRADVDAAVAGNGTVRAESSVAAGGEQRIP